MIFRRKGDKARYSFVDRFCIGRTCWNPGMFQHRGATMSGSRNTGSPASPCCMNRAYFGCPEGPMGERHEQSPEYGIVTIVGLPQYDKALAAKRKSEGWR